MAKKKKSTLSKKERSRRNSLLLAGGAVLAVAFIVLCVWLFRPGPIGTFKNVTRDTILSDNFTVDFTLDINGEKMDGQLCAAIDKKNRDISVYMQFSDSEGDFDGGIYKNHFLIRNANSNKVKKTDITAQVEQFFVLLEQTNEPDWSVLLRFPEVDLHEEISKDFDFAVFMECLGRWLNEMDDKKWAEKNAGFVTDTADGITTYSYSPDPYTLAQVTAPMFKKAFRDPARYDQLTNYIDNAKYLFMSGKADFLFHTQNDLLLDVQFHLHYHTTDIQGSFSFLGINNTTVNIDTLGFYFEEAV
jgi:hypothetical protein